MKKTNGWVATNLTPEESKLHEKQKLSADPTDRLFTNYYTVRRHMHIADYYGQMAFAQDLPQRKALGAELDAQLAVLRKEYIADLDLWAELNFNMCQVWAPVKFKLIPPDAMEY